MPGALVAGLMASREDVHDWLAEAGALTFALERLADHAGREAEAAAHRAAAGLPLDRPLVALSHIASKFNCEFLV